MATSRSSALPAVLLLSGLTLLGCSEQATTPAAATSPSPASCTAAGTGTATKTKSTSGLDLVGGCATGGGTGSTTAGGTTVGGTTTGGTGGTGGGTTSGGTTSGGTGNGSFDLCADGLEKAAGLTDQRLALLVGDICGLNSQPNALAQLRLPANLFTGQASTVLTKTEADTDTTSQVRLHTAAIYDTDVADYWDLVQLQLVNAAGYKQAFEVDPNAQLKNVQPGTGSVTYNYYNSSGEGGAVDYVATTTFLTLLQGQAYVAATLETQKNETMKNLAALIIINKTADGKVEAFTVSDQTYEFTSGQSAAIKSRAAKAATDEQLRAWHNAPKAPQAKALLPGG